MTELRELVTNLQNDGQAVILMMDANGTISSDTGLPDFIATCDLVDLHRNDPPLSTYIESESRRIDYMLGCHRVAATVTRQGTLAYSEGPQSDHRGLYVDLQIRDILGDQPAQLVESDRHRSLHSGNPEMVATYLQSMRAYYEAHNMSERIQTMYLEHKGMSIDEVRKLLTSWDNDQGRAMQHAEGSLKVRESQYKWSPKLRKCRCDHAVLETSFAGTEI